MRIGRNSTTSDSPHLPHGSEASRRASEVIGPQPYLDAPREGLYSPIRARAYDAELTLRAMDAEGIDIAVVYRTFAHMVVSIDDLQPEHAIAYCAAFND